MTHYRVELAQSQNAGKTLLEDVSAGNPRAAARIASRMLDFLRRHSGDGDQWDTWAAASMRGKGSRPFIYARGRIGGD